MPRKTTPSVETLQKLGAKKLAQLVMDAIEANPGFKRQVSAALAGEAGPEAVAKIIDRRLAGLERAKSFIEWDRARAFRDDLQSLIDTIEKELAAKAPAMAVDRLLRFIATHEKVFERVDDSNGAVQHVYLQAIDLVGTFAPNLSPDELSDLPAQIMDALGETSHGYLGDLTDAVAPHLPGETNKALDEVLARKIKQRSAEEAKETSDRWFYSMTSEWRDMRQTLAAARNDLDLLITLEEQKPPHIQDTVGIAERLLEAGRADEALDWMRRANTGAQPQVNQSTDARLLLEARTLDVLGDRAAAKDLLWRGFETSLSAEALRAYLKLLADFEDMDAEEKAMAIAMAHKDAGRALTFLMAWPRHDLAARLIVDRRDQWDGGQWYVLPDVAKTLEHDHSLAAMLLYRVLLNDILLSARSKAYGHGARYLAKLGMLAADAEADPSCPKTLDTHAQYLAQLKAAHGRKTGFWSRVPGK